MSTSRDARARTFGVTGAVVSVRRGERDDTTRGHRARRERAGGRPVDATRSDAGRVRGTLDDGTTARVRDARARASGVATMADARAAAKPWTAMSLTRDLTRASWSKSRQGTPRRAPECAPTDGVG